ncbi:muscleblind-like protein 1 isoform X29 [Lates japonicus]|uniref:Muscleblind-like protein 1 isoform X29 n=1 Tax=Lates japonicus TaxID=270547 RepID=A0AAD3MNX2_LATJO|nr:muscleblind-like protein 1 isoform X29 [Lates japonicus]
MGRLNIVHDTCSQRCSHDARWYSSHCVCSHHICHKRSLRNCLHQSGLFLIKVDYQRIHAIDSNNICRSSE